MVNGNRHDDTSSNPGQDRLHFTKIFSLGEATSLGEGKLLIQTCYTLLKN